MTSINEIYDKIIDREKVAELLRIPEFRPEQTLAAMTKGRREHFLDLLTKAGIDDGG